MTSARLLMQIQPRIRSSFASLAIHFDNCFLVSRCKLIQNVPRTEGYVRPSRQEDMDWTERFPSPPEQKAEMEANKKSR